MVSSSEVRSSIQKAQVSEVVKERALQQLKDAEGGAAVEAAIDRHGKALLKALAEKMMASDALGSVALADVCQLVCVVRRRLHAHRMGAARAGRHAEHGTAADHRHPES